MFETRPHREDPGAARTTAPGPGPATAPVSLAVGLVALAAYLWLAPPVSADRDSSEFALVLALDGIAHPTGYPLYTLFGHRFVAALHAAGVDQAYAANAWSALGGAVTLALLHALAARLLPRDAPLAPAERAALPLLPPALLLLNPGWTQVATVAEVHSWHVAWGLGLALAFARGLEGIGTGTPPGARFAAGWGLLCGAGLAHHATALLAIVPLTVALAGAARPSPGRAARGLALAAACAVPPLASYLLLRWKAAAGAPVQWSAFENTWAGLWAHATGAQYAGVFGRFAPEPLERALIERAVLPFLVPGMVGLAMAAARAPRGPRRVVFAGLLATALAQTAFAMLYGVDDPGAYFLPALAAGLASATPLCAPPAGASPVARAGRRGAASALVVLVLALAPGWTHAALEARRQFIGFDAFLHDLWRRIPVGRGFVLWPHDLSHRLREYQLLRGERPALEIVNPWTFTHPAARRRFAERHGFDPLPAVGLAAEDLRASGPLTPGARRFFEATARRINQRSELPVVVFEPEVSRVRVLPKAGRGTPTLPGRARTLEPSR
uniref:DUF2723 domain-containing protein n=1 Tax=Eiseniibacteriota bacterium TaxID=2212470 RepID=A0A832I566_UNCEI